jgi:hypothetical protein
MPRDPVRRTSAGGVGVEPESTPPSPPSSAPASSSTPRGDLETLADGTGQVHWIGALDAVHRWNIDLWTGVSLPASGNPYAIWAAGPDDVWAAGSCRLLRRDP